MFKKNNLIKFKIARDFIYDTIDYSKITYYALIKEKENVIVFWLEDDKIESETYSLEEVMENIENKDWILL